MTAVAFLLLIVTLVVAVGDWIAVHHGNQTLEYLCKPLTMVCLIGVAWAIEPDNTTARSWFIAALVLSLLGDVFLMLDHQPDRNLFVFGLGAFLLAHLAYVVGMLVDGVHGVGVLVGVLVVAVLILVVGTQLIRAAYANETAMAGPVMAYTAVISAMVIAAAGVGRPLGVLGAGLFYASDAMIGWQRFVRRYSWFPLAIIVTYHLGQTGLVLSLI
ncbi:MAG TPA: lysoplasmalogenase [Acidimicrobiales bacterium]|jgi:uncharacterized membrane protein YhhN